MLILLGDKPENYRIQKSYSLAIKSYGLGRSENILLDASFVNTFSPDCKLIFMIKSFPEVLCGVNDTKYLVGSTRDDLYIKMLKQCKDEYYFVGNIREHRQSTSKYLGYMVELFPASLVQLNIPDFRKILIDDILSDIV